MCTSADWSGSQHDHAPCLIGLVSRSSGRPCCWGETSDGRHLFCVYEFLDDMTIIPVTAYEVPD